MFVLVVLLLTVKMNRISEIVKREFSTLPLEEKIRIKELGRPLPQLTLHQIRQRRTENRKFTLRFSMDIYKKNNWICGCEVSNLLYCFPCVLFYNNSASGSSDSGWARSGIKDLHNLSIRIKKHEDSRGHINACAAFALLGKTNIRAEFSSEYRHHIAEYNKRVRKNRYVLKRLICCIKFCSAFELASRGNNDSQNHGIFRELIDFSAELDVTLREHLNNATSFIGTSKTIQNDILDCMLDVCRKEISSQIKNSEFLGIQCDETADVTNWCQMVIIFRYVFNGRICENFWGFKRIKDKTAQGITESIEEEIDPLISQTPQKLIAQTYDGANVMSGGGVQAHIKNKYPCAHYIHCYAHELNLSMQKAVSQHAKVRVFFGNLSAIPAFFSNSSNRCDVLEQIVEEKLPKTGWNYNIRTVNCVYENREQLIEVFEKIEEECVKTSTANEAYGLRRALEDPEFVFWLTLFHKILPHVDVLYNQMHSRNKESTHLKKDIRHFEEAVSYIRTQTGAIDEYLEANFASGKRNVEKSARAKEVCDVIMAQMRDRFSYRGHIQASELFNNEDFQKFATGFPTSLLNAVTSFYPQLCKSRLKTELEVLYSRLDFRNISGAMNFVSFITNNNMDETFAETRKLLNIILTTPMTTDESERCFSTLKRIKSFLRNTMDNDRLNALAMMCINKNLVQDIDNFDDKVLECFISMKNRSFELNYSYKK